ncbi:hypothetical protein [Borreliella lanei]|uniref:Lipoprotein n=1 Tax=Borreliella lanei TaxID=373540 RepID=A0A7W9ZD83_9SPIR|nr:hypothetical protein [Borreliella lanei]MBB6208497.1 hypothetical protein [Borreliella lanei]
MKTKNKYPFMVFLTFLIFIAACSQDSQNKQDKVLNYLEDADSPKLTPTTTVNIDFHSGLLFLDSIRSAHEALYKADLLESTNFFNYEVMKSQRDQHGLPSKPPAYIYYTKAPNESTFFTIAIHTPHFGGPHLGQLEIVIRAHDLAPQGFLVYRVNHHERTSSNINRRYYRFFDSTIKNIHRADTSNIKLKNLSGYLESKISNTILDDRGKITKFVNTVLNALQQEPEDATQLTPYFSEAVSAIVFSSLTPLLDYRIRDGIANVVRTDYLSSALPIPYYLNLVKQWEGINYLQYIKENPSKDVRHGKPAITPEEPLVFMNIIKYK